MQNIIIIILVISVIYILYRLPSVEKMSNIDVATENKIREIYKIDTDAIRNLSNLAKDLTVNGKLTVPGGLEIEGGLKVSGETNLDNSLKIKGFTEQLGGGSVEGKLYYRHSGANGSDDTDPYYIEKVRSGGNNNHLRLTINDDANESFQIWGYSCKGPGGCGGAGKELFNFSANGSLNFLPRGSIIAWNSGTAPSGWALCDGQNGTPDLRGRFILGLGKGTGLTNRTINQKGGAETHTLTVNEIPPHSHTFKFHQHHRSFKGDSGHPVPWNVGDLHSKNTLNTGGGQAHNNMPPFYVLAYIMRL